MSNVVICKSFDRGINECDLNQTFKEFGCNRRTSNNRYKFVKFGKRFSKVNNNVYMRAVYFRNVKSGALITAHCWEDLNGHYFFYVGDEVNCRHLGYVIAADAADDVTAYENAADGHHGYPVRPRCTNTTRYTVTNDGDYTLALGAFDDGDAHRVFCPDPCGDLVIIDSAIELTVTDTDLFRFFADAAQLGLYVTFNRDDINEGVTVTGYSRDLVEKFGLEVHRSNPDAINEAH